MKAKYIDKTFPITLQDLIDLAKSENLDPKDLKLIMNSNQADLSAYVQCALLNQDCDKISIELYTEASDGLREDISIDKTSQDKSLAETIDHYRKEFYTLIENMESDGLAYTTITSILKQGSKGYI